jgi:N-acetylglucosaminyldiphosphoundecaprenol N-acetyl-beta-D-mannosaminyltransferase
MTAEITKGRMLGVRIGTRSLAELVVSAETAIRVRRDSFIFACANPHSLVVARHDAEFREALEGTSAVVADGVGCIWGAALAGRSVATLSPPFGQWSDCENDDMISRIRQFEPDVLWVGMTAPKQEKWVAANAARLPVPVIGSIGAVFDYYAGVTQRAPQWICDLGLEWLYRLPREPKRLWRRTVVSAPVFLWHVVRERISR